MHCLLRLTALIGLVSLEAQAAMPLTGTRPWPALLLFDRSSNSKLVL